MNCCEPFNSIESCELCNSDVLKIISGTSKEKQIVFLSGYDKEGNFCTEELELNGISPVSTKKILYPCKDMKFEKPGANKKKTLKTPRLKMHNIERPEDPFCRRCDDETGTESYRHLETFRKHEIGKGTGTKSHDKFTAWLCNECNEEMSNRRPDKNNKMAVLAHAEYWNWLIMKTWLL